LSASAREPDLAEKILAESGESMADVRPTEAKAAAPRNPSRRTYQHMHAGHDLQQKEFAKQNRFL